MRSFYKFCATVFVWYFIAFGTDRSAPATQGPFPNEETCDDIRDFVREGGNGALMTRCWSLGRDETENTESRFRDSFVK